MPFPVEAFPYIAAYFWIGLLVVIVDLWRSELPTEKKVLWTVLNLFLGIASLPVYWMLVLHKKSNKVL